MDLLRALLERYGLDPDAPNYGLLSDDDLASLHGEMLGLFDELRGDDAADGADGVGGVDIEALTEIANASDAILAEDESRQAAAVAAAAAMGRTLSSLDRRVGRGAAAAVPRDTAPTRQLGRVAPRHLSLDALAAARRPVNAPALAASRGGGQAAFVAQVTDRVGQSLDLDEVAETLVAHVESGSVRPGARALVARARAEFPEELVLGQDSRANLRTVDQVIASARAGLGVRGRVEPGFMGLVAAGGLCAPATPYYSQDTVGSYLRPVRDGLPLFEVRGAVRFVRPPTLGDIRSGGPGDDAAVGVWDQANDVAAAVDPAVTKPIQRATCDEELTVEVVAITERLKVGNQLARTFPERVRAFIDLTLVQAARTGDGRILERIKSMSTETSLDEQILGSRRDLMVVWRKAAWAIRSRNRMDRREPLQLIVPDVAVEQFIADGLRQLPGDQRDRLTVEEVIGEMGDIGVQVLLTPDMPAHIAPAQAAASQLVDLASPIEWALFPMGTFGVIDRGTLDLGFSAGTPIRDSAGNAQNDHELFAETWEEVVRFLNLDAIWGRTPVCPTGTTSGTTEVLCDEAS